ncbi:MAG: hypothetical protein WC356_06565 [Candidatus Micrarchaeia archaeon]|jgi:hypothetical protein
MVKIKTKKPAVKKTVKKPVKSKKIEKKASNPVAKIKRVKPNVKKSLDSLKEDLYGVNTVVDTENPEQRKIHLQTITFELAAVKQLIDRVSNQLKIIEEHLEEVKNQ